MRSATKKQNLNLPYIDNAKAVFITLAINLGVVFVFNWPQGVSYAEVLWDSFFCAIITTVVNIWIVYSKLKKMRALGAMPVQVPESRFMQRLPQHPFALGIIYAIGFAALTVGANALFLWFFNMPGMAFTQWLAYKLLYASLLSIKIVECCIFRYVQPDWALCAQRAKALAKQEPAAQPVKNPLPKIGVFKAMYSSVITNIALTIIIGSLLGGVRLESSGALVIFPATTASIAITGLIFGLITGVMVTRSVLKATRAIITEYSSAIVESAVADKRLSWMPKEKMALTCLISTCVMIFSALALPAIMAILGLTVLNFYQFIAVITIYAAMLSKPLAFILSKRCLQPDYVLYTLGKEAS